MLSRTSLAALVAACRRSKGLQQRRLATELGLSPAGLSHIENNRNPVSERFLRVFAERLFGAELGAHFVNEVLLAADDDIEEIAKIVEPGDPTRFEADFYALQAKLGSQDAARGERDSRQTGMRSTTQSFKAHSISTEGPFSIAEPWVASDLESRRTGPLQSVPLKIEHSTKSSRTSGLRTDYSARNSDTRSRDQTVELLRQWFNDASLKPRLTSRNTIPSRDGHRVHVDLIEDEMRIAIDVRTPGQYGFRFAAEMIAKCVLLEEVGFRFIVCFTETPASETDLAIDTTLRRFGGAAMSIEELQDRLSNGRL